MYDDFWAGYNSGNGLSVNTEPREKPIFGIRTREEAAADRQKKQPAGRPGVYDKSKFIRMQGPNGEVGEIYADGKMFIVFGTKKWARKFGSRPFAIKYMQQRGWVLL